MKTLSLFFSLLLAFPLYAEDKKALSIAEQLLEITDFEKSVAEGAGAGFTMVEKSLAPQNLTPEEMAEVKTAFSAYIKKMAADPELKSKAIKAYENAFTESELKELIIFYQTPLGKKTLTKLPSLMQEIMGFSFEIAQRHVGGFQKTLGEILERKNAREENE